MVISKKLITFVPNSQKMRRLTLLLTAILCLTYQFSDKPSGASFDYSGRETEQTGLLLQQAEGSLFNVSEDTGNREAIQGTSFSLGSVSRPHTQNTVKRVGRRFVRPMHGKGGSSPIALHQCIPVTVYRLPLNVFSPLHALSRTKDYYVFALRHILI